MPHAQRRVTCSNDPMRLAAFVAAVAAAVNLLVLGLLHVVSPEVDPVTRVRPWGVRVVGHDRHGC
jgi:hypothetical protein